MNESPQPSTLWELIHAAPGNNPAIIVPDAEQPITYDSLRKQVRDFASALKSAGVDRGDRVAICLPNGLPGIVAFLGASVAGTAAPLNPGYRFDEFAFYLEDTSAKVLVVPSEGAEEARRAATERGIPILACGVDAGGNVTLSGASPGPEVTPPSPADVALVLHTSGSTGRPKRVPLKHSNLAVSARNVVNTYSLGPSDVSLCLMPLFHVHGLMASTTATLLSGGSVVVPPKFNPLGFWRLIRDHRVTWYSAVPTIHQLIVARRGSGGRPPEAETLRFVRSCSAALAPELMAKMEDYFGVPVLEAYGMTEASHQMASNPLPPSARKPGSVGPGTGVKIATLDGEGKPVPAGTPGEVCISGPNVITEYENNPEATAKSFFGEWFRTGDQGILDADGYLHLTGRLKEMINRGGEKISPREIDEAILTHPAVNEAVAFGIPHPTWGEEVAAAVTLKEGVPATEAEIIAHCKSRLADFKVPRKVHIVTAIPRTATGKIQRLNVAASFAGAKG